MRIRKSILKFSVVMILAMVVITGCQKDDKNNNEPNNNPNNNVNNNANSNANNNEVTSQVPPSQEEITQQPVQNNRTYADGEYRGFYNDGGIQQISIQFMLKDGKFQEMTYRGINYKDGNYLADDASDVQKQIATQFMQAAEYMIGKTPEAVPDLLTPGNFVQDMDAVSGATLRSNKLASAINDALNRGVYRLTDTTQLPNMNTVSDGIYRGFYYDDGIEQIAIEFEVKDNKFDDIEYRSLNYKDGNYLADNASDIQEQVTDQYEEAIDYLEGKKITVINDLYEPGKLVKDMDAVTGATLRSGKLVSAFHDALCRGVYKLTDTTELVADSKKYEDGVYRGYYYDGGIEQLALEFKLVDNKFTEVTFRAMNYKDGNYLDENANAVQKQVAAQFNEAAQYLIGKDVNAVYNLFLPGKIVSDMDAVTGATLRSSKMISALHDGLNRGLYKKAEK